MPIRAIDHGPEVIKGTGISTGVFFGFQRRTSRLFIKNTDASNDLLYKFQPSNDAGIYATLSQGKEPDTIVDSVMGINVKANSGQTATFEVLGFFDYLT